VCAKCTARAVERQRESGTEISGARNDEGNHRALEVY
jgi:hypothetical protein